MWMKQPILYDNPNEGNNLIWTWALLTSVNPDYSALSWAVWMGSILVRFQSLLYAYHDVSRIKVRNALHVIIPITRATGPKSGVNTIKTL